METTNLTKRVVLLPPEATARLERIRAGLRRGDQKYIAECLNVTATWVGHVIMGIGISEKVLRAAEALISEREN